MKKLVASAIAVAILALIPAALARAHSGSAQASTFTGILQDKACSNKALRDNDPYAAASKHTKTCALMPPCAGSGYGVVTKEGKFLKFDAKGDEQAKALLEKSEKKDNMAVTVEGAMKGDVLEVKTIKEQ